MSDDAEKAPAVASTEKGVASKSKSKSGGPKGKGKKSAAPVEEINYEYGDIVLARLRGYPPWPARIVDPNDLPANVLAQRPKSAVSYCAQFFPVGDFSWLPPREISPLKPHQIDAFINEPHRKASGSLRTAYLTAQDPTEWDAQQAAALRQLEEAEADEDVDELEEEEDEEEEPTSGKRKRSAPAQKKDAKKAKTTKKAAAEPKPKAAAEKPKSDKPKDKAASAAATDDAGADPLAADPEAVKVKDWRHKLQRAFLVKGVPDASEMDTYDDLFRSIENYTDMKLEYLQFSKIGKVLKKIAALDSIPRNDELQITTRATNLMNKWQNEIIQPSEAAEAAKSNGSEDKPAAAAAPAAENTTIEEKSEA